MALLDWIAPESGLRVEGEGVWLRPPRAADFAEWRELRAQSRAFLQPWEPTWPVDDLSRAAFRRRLMAYARDREAGLAYPFFVSHIFRMTTFFLIAGFFAHMTFHKRGAKAFVLDRAKRIALPLVVFWPLLITGIVLGLSLIHI